MRALCRRPGLGRFGLGAAVEALLEVAAELLAGRTQRVTRAPRLEPEDPDLLVTHPVAARVALGLGQGAHSHGATVRRGPDGGPRARAVAFGTWRRSLTTSRPCARGSRRCRLLRVLRRPGRNAGSRLGDRRDRDVPPRIERERRRPVRDEHPHRGADRPGPPHRRSLPQLRPGRSRVRPEHVDAQLRAHAHGRPRVAARRRDRRDEARPRRERLPLARARARPRPRHPLRRHPRGHVARPRRPRTAARRADEGRRLPGRRELGRDADRRARIVELAHEAGALAWADAVHYAPHGPIDVGGSASTCSSARRTSSSARTWASRSHGPSCSSAGGRTRSARRRTTRPAGASRPARSSTSCSRASSRRSSTSTRSAGTRSARTSARSASASSPDCPDAYTLHGLPTMDGRVATFAFTHAERTAARDRDAARRPRASASGGATTTRSR